MKWSTLALAPLSAAIIHTGIAPPARADTIVLDDDDVIDWVRVFSSSHWKHKDACLQPNGLIKFDLSDIGPATEILGARLHLFVEFVGTESSIEFWHVTDDSWSYVGKEPEELWNWPMGPPLGVVAVTDTVSLTIDVTARVRDELELGPGEFSIGITADVNPYPPLRISSPLAPIQRMRPCLVVEYAGLPEPPPISDLAVSTADIRFSPMRPVPGETVGITARVRNIGAGDAWSVPVSFWDGPPDASAPIGTVAIPHLPGGGGSETATVSWTSSVGLREIHVVVDPDQSIVESDETNNVDFRTFLVTEPDAYSSGLESFEYPGLRSWHSDFDVPKQFTYPGPKSFYINRSGAESYHGEHAMEMYLDGTADDGTIWIESAWPVEPNSTVDVSVLFELFRYYADIAFQPVCAVTLLDPEFEMDFDVLPVPAAEGWTLHDHDRMLFTGPYDMVHVAVGLTVTWETHGTFFLDLISASVSSTPVGTGDSSGTFDLQGMVRNIPNPMGALTTIAYHLDREGPVALRIFDVGGRRVATLREGRERAGFHEVIWDGTDEAGWPVVPGIYVYELRTSTGTESRKLLLAR